MEDQQWPDVTKKARHNRENRGATVVTKRDSPPKVPWTRPQQANAARCGISVTGAACRRLAELAESGLVPSSPLVLTAAAQGAGLDARRGIVRLRQEVLAALGVLPWAPLRLTGARTTAALAALAPPTSPVGALLCDDLLLANLGVGAGAEVRVEAAGEQPARMVRVSGPPEISSRVPADVLRLALLGKCVSRGDQVSLLPQDLSLPPDTDANARDVARRQIAEGVASWQTVLLLVGEADPDVAGIVTMSTVVGWADGTATATSAAPAATAAAGQPLVGLEAPAGQLTEWLDVGFHGQALLTRLGGSPQLGVLISGPAGSGKVAMVNAVAASVGAAVVRLWGPTLAGTEPNAAAQQVRAAADQARRTTPCVLLIEDVDAIVPSTGGPLLGLMLDAVRQLVATSGIAVVCTSSQPEGIAPALREPGMLERELVVPLPNRSQREQMLRSMTHAMPLASDVNLADVAARTPGFVAADLAALCRETALRAAHRQQGAPGDAVTVCAADVDEAIQVIRPTAIRGDDIVEPSGLTLDDVGDMAEVKQVLTEAVLWPLNYPDTFRRLGIEPTRGVLLHGPPGCGKTYIVRALAGSGNANVIAVKGAELLSKWVGESERGVRDLFRRAGDAAPALVFLDEVDALAPVRGGGGDTGVSDRVVAALLTELDGVEELRDVVVVAATNRLDIVDPALLRPGRLERHVYVPPPDAAARAEILRAAAKSTPLAADVDLAALAASCDGYSAADCAALVREAALTAMRESLSAAEVTAAHFTAARTAVKPSLHDLSDGGGAIATPPSDNSASG